MTVKSSSSGTDALARKVYDLAPDTAVTNEQRKNLNKAIRELPPKHKNVMRLCYGIGRSKPMTQMQTAQILGITENWVNQIYNRALEALRTGKKIEIKRTHEKLKKLRNEANGLFRGLNEAVFDDADETIKSRRREVDAAMIALNPEQSIAIELTFGIESGKRHSLHEASDMMKLPKSTYCTILQKGLTELFKQIQMNASGPIASRSANTVIAPIQIDEYARAKAKYALQYALDKVTPIQRAIILARYPLENENPKTLKEIAQDKKLSRERIRQIEEAALKKLSIHPKLRDFAPNK